MLRPYLLTQLVKLNQGTRNYTERERWMLACSPWSNDAFLVVNRQDGLLRPMVVVVVVIQMGAVR